MSQSMPSIADRRWTPGPDRPLLPEGALDVWRADLTVVADELGGLLCGEENARAARLLDERGRQLWVRSRGVLRALLGRYLQKDPRALRFALGEHGKPALLDHAATELTANPGPQQARPPQISFNLSHSGQTALYAFTSTMAVGVDVELARGAIDAVALAARMLGPAEAARLERLDHVTRQREFLRAWVRHEAAVKCLGVGVGGAGAGIEASQPWIAELEVGPDAAAAVALEAPPRALHCWEWPTVGDADSLG
jgi:4'-phosphopantetheinyl transferase